ncbi:FHA domain-containing protein [candidate division CSSED10-310 bacterium]|uniref:FHA domain-containing protein n=1 Tax=candidate division CSSED10-310 bacterium TaxID=2855610 RepID=A0ABV6YWC8_UNCC1
MIDEKDNTIGDEEDEATVLFQEKAKPAKLVIKLANNQRRDHHLLKQSTLLGKSSLCDVLIDDQAASDRHAKIDVVGTNYFITDLNSQNGTRVNGQFISYQPLNDGDAIQIGRTFLDFCLIRRKAAPVQEETVIAEEATTISAQFLTKKQPKLKAQLSDKVEILKKSKGLRRFFSSPGRAMGTSFLMAVVLLIVLITISQKNRQQIKFEPVGQETPGERLAETPLGPSVKTPSETKTEDLSKRAAQYRSQRLVVQYYEDAQKSFQGVEQTYNDEMQSPTLANLSKCQALYEGVSKQFEKVSAIDSSYQDLQQYETKINERMEAIKKRKFSITMAQKSRKERLKQAGKDYMAQGDYRNAKLTFEKLLQLAPQDQEVKSLLLKIEQRKRKQADLIRTRKKIKDYLLRMQTNLNLGKAALTENRYASALKAWQKVVDDFETIDEFKIGSKTSEYQQAQEMMEKARVYQQGVKPKLDELHDQVRSIYGRGVTFESIGETEKAVQEWRKIFTIITDPEDDYYIKAKEKLMRYE